MGIDFAQKRELSTLSTQNCGVVVKGDVQSGEKDFFGMLTDVIELEYDSRHRVVLFKCEWYDVYAENVGIKVDAYGLTSVNVKRFLKTNEPYVLASQVDQVYYVRDHMHQDWRVVIKTNPCNFYDIPSDDEDEEANSFMNVDGVVGEAYVPCESDSITSLVRGDLNADFVDVHVVTRELQRHRKGKTQVVNDEEGSESSDEEDVLLFADEPNHE